MGLVDQESIHHLLTSHHKSSYYTKRVFTATLAANVKVVNEDYSIIRGADICMYCGI